MSFIETAKEYFIAHKDYIFAHAAKWLTALLILVLGVLASKLGKRWLRLVLNRSRVRDDALLKNFFLRTITVSIWIAAALLALDALALPIGSLVAGLGITGLILGFGLRDTLSNFAAGLLLLIYRPFRAGELIEVEGTMGVVEELTIVNMQMTTTDGVRVIMPNSKVWGTKIVNHSLSKRRRLELELKVRDDDVENAIKAIQAALADDPRILSTPPPHIRVLSLAENAATLSIWAWTSPEDFQAVSADEYLRLLRGLREAELQIV
jgi:small conductance mechanosensitive channel